MIPLSFLLLSVCSFCQVLNTACAMADLLKNDPFCMTKADYSRVAAREGGKEGGVLKLKGEGVADSAVGRCTGSTGSFPMRRL